MPAAQPAARPPVDAVYRIIREELAPHFPQLARHGSTPELESDPLYLSLEDRVHAVLESPETGDYTRAAAPARSRYRIVAWNLERGIQFEGQLEALQSHPRLGRGRRAAAHRDRCRDGAVVQPRGGPGTGARAADAFRLRSLLPQSRQGRRRRAYVEGENDLGLHGNAIFSRYPLRNVRAVPLQERQRQDEGPREAPRPPDRDRRRSGVSQLRLGPFRFTWTRSRASATATTRCATCSTPCAAAARR